MRIRWHHWENQINLFAHECTSHFGFGLGEADFVVRLGSDGRRGFVEHAGELTAPATVRAITSVMEGGVEAFERRAAFYHEVLGDGHGQ